MEKKRIYKHRPYQPVATLTKVSEEQKNEIRELYLHGSSQSSIEKTLRVTRKTIRTVLKQSGIARDKSSQWRIRYGSSLKENVFDELTPESLYWIGFLYADGHIRKHKEYSIEIEIELKDIDHLKKYRDFLGCNKEIKTFDNSCRLKVYSQVLHKRLQELGFTHDKSLTAKPHELLKDSRDFWRGVVDGDGCIAQQYESPFIHLCGTQDTIQEYINFLNRNGVNTKAQPNKPQAGRSLHQVGLAAQKAEKAMDILYKDSKVHLNRKFEKYQQLTNKNQQNNETTRLHSISQ